MVFQSVERTALLCSAWIDEAQHTRMLTLYEELNTMNADGHELDLQLAIAYKKAQNEAKRRHMVFLELIAHSGTLCHFPFNELKADGNLAVRVRDDKEVCDRKHGDRGCVREQARGQNRRDQKTVASEQAHPTQKDEGKKTHTKNPGGLASQLVSTNGHSTALSSRDKEER
jgi:hypothetical protein